MAVLSYASLLDWRTRRIGNVYWIGLSVFGLLLIPLQLGTDDEPLEYLLVLIPILAILSDVYWDAGDNTVLAKSAPAVKYVIAVVSVIALGYVWLDEAYFQHLLAVPVMMLFIVLMYMLDIIRGGADAKALIALSILFPLYPAIDSLPLIQSESGTGEILFPFAFVILLTAAIIVAFFPLGFLVKNLSAGEFGFPQGLLGYKMNAADLKGRHVWLMERIEDGKHRTYARPRTGEDIEKEVRLLVEAGHKRIWVTPKVPFIIPMLVGLVFSTIVGNILLLLFEA
jgi:preflagellin peptidase FlaK